MSLNTITTRITPSPQITGCLSSIAFIATCAKGLQLNQFYNQLKQVYDQIVQQYNASIEPPKKGFFEKFLMGISSTTEHNYSERLEYLEDDTVFKAMCEGSRNWTTTQFKEQLNMNVLRHNRLYGSIIKISVPY